MRKSIPIEPVFCNYIPPRHELEQGKIYISEEYQTCSHLCACGCGCLVVMPLSRTAKGSGWQLFKTADGMVSFSPSIGNKQQACKTHYFIEGNTVRFTSDFV